MEGIGKTLQKFWDKNKDKIKSIEKEMEDGRSYWIYLNKGFVHADGVHAIHEWTTKDLMKEFQGVEVCECNECTGEFSIGDNVKWSKSMHKSIRSKVQTIAGLNGDMITIERFHEVKKRVVRAEVHKSELTKIEKATNVCINHAPYKQDSAIDSFNRSYCTMCSMKGECEWFQKNKK